MVDTPRATAALLSLVLAASLVACSSAGEERGPGVDGWNPQSWKHLAHAQFQLPDTAIAESDKATPNTAVRQLCEPDELPADAGDVAAIRSLFDQDFTKMAVVTQDPQTAATHVGYVDRAGKFTDLTGNEDFGNTPHEHNAAFSRDGSAVWFTYEVTDQPGISTKDRVASRALAGDHKAVDQLEIGMVGESNLIMVGRAPSRAVVDSSAFLSPDGKRLLAGGYVLDVPAEGQGVGRDLVEKGRYISCDGGWLDNDTVLCSADGRFAALDIASGAKPGAPIVPSNDYDNHAMVISPDGQRFAFLSEKGAATDYYLCDTTPGSTPQKVERTGEFSALGDTAAFIEWR
ncbi:PD40 domain-containing protein [Nonomuraea jabiensis]|uniref:WD40-like Beta Propeller Repeat n=1 Tax=Nonomuraea jabiensis TaxID=882448 RepID=A0A7W9GAI3_9ACTN|nr:PD40 domain-containing protein [Nonomuraea jabiensis]MBB5780214.1 hypothetical protein [Nonomuraea jabiensis]